MRNSLLALRKNYIFYLGIIAILISAATWAMDLLAIVQACPYCRVQRTAIGLLGVLMLLPCQRWLTVFAALLIGIVGTHVSAAHIFMHIRNETFTLMYTGMAFAALCLQIGQILLLLDRTWKRVRL